MARECVAIVRVVEQRLDEAVEELIRLLGGLEGVIGHESQVLIKPNLVFAPTQRGITHGELVEAVVRMVKGYAPREIIIAEGAADTYTSQSFRFRGLYRIAARYGARLVDLNLEEGVKTPVPDAEGLGREYIMLPRVVTESDALISIPVFKLWGGSPLSLSLKNLFGLYGGRYYGYNKDSDVRGRQLAHYGLPGEVGIEQGIHKPSPPQAICAMNSVVKTDLAIIDGLEGGDGMGNWLRLDTLIAGRNPVATDTVGLAMAGYTAIEHPTFRLCAEHGLGPATLDEISVVGESIERAGFCLERLRNNVIEMPVRFCLNLLSTDELFQIQRAMRLYGFWLEGDAIPAGRGALLERLAMLIEAEGYYGRALGVCSEYAVTLAELIAEEGGTSGDMRAIESTFCARWGESGQYYMPAARTLTRLGLAYAVEGASRDYYLLPDGLSAALAQRRGV